MPRPIPCCGFPSKTAAVVSLYNDGKSTSGISAITGISSKDVTALRSSSERPLKRRPIKTYDFCESLPPHLLVRLAKAAEIRGLSSKTLAAIILETVVSEGLFNAVLDDDLELSILPGKPPYRQSAR